MPVCSRLQRGNQTQARFQRDRKRGAYEIVRLDAASASRPGCVRLSSSLFTGTLDGRDRGKRHSDRGFLVLHGLSPPFYGKVVAQRPNSLARRLP